MTQEFAELLAEHRQNYLGPKIVRLLDEIIDKTIKVYPAPRYGGIAEWTPDAKSEIGRDWIQADLIERGELAWIFAQAVTVESLRKRLAGSLRQQMVVRVEKTDWYRIFDRADAVLRAETSVFLPIEKSARRQHQRWTLVRDKKEESSTVPASALLTAVHRRRDGSDWSVVRYRPDARIGSPILRRQQLREFLEVVLERADGTLTLSTIAEILQTRFGLVPPLSTSARPDLREPDDPFEDRLSMRELASQIREQVPPAEARLIRDYLAARADPRADFPVGVRDAVEALIRRISAIAETRDPAELREILGYVIDFLFED